VVAADTACSGSNCCKRPCRTSQPPSAACSAQRRRPSLLLPRRRLRVLFGRMVVLPRAHRRAAARGELHPAQRCDCSRTREALAATRPRLSQRLPIRNLRRLPEQRQRLPRIFWAFVAQVWTTWTCGPKICVSSAWLQGTRRRF